MNQLADPDLTTFLTAPEETVAAVAPATVMFAAGGTRRDAVLHGLAVDRYSAALAHFSIQRFTDTAGRFFRLGVKNFIAITIRSSQLEERGPYRDFIIAGARETIGRLGYPLYRQLGCRVRLLGYEEIPELAELAAEMDAETGQNGPHTIWWLITRSNTAAWQQVLTAAQGAHDFATVSQRIFGCPVPPVELFVSFGKPFVSPEIMPLALFGTDTHCYFYQRPGYYLSEVEVRSIIYDFAYLRQTWVADKTSRYSDVPDQRHIWLRSHILGLGQRIGPFWYPAVPVAP